MKFIEIRKTRDCIENGRWCDRSRIHISIKIPKLLDFKFMWFLFLYKLALRNLKLEKEEIEIINFETMTDLERRTWRK